MISISRWFSFILVSVALLQPLRAGAQIYADVAVGGAVSGTFTISLKYQNAPVTVANFIGLATGKKAWLDGTTGAIHNTPYYTGVTFHRVIAAFMSQTGSRNGLGTDGPGYVFRNEIDPSLTHATLYTVAMANAGINSNGAGWYITSKDILASTVTSLDYNYTIFGVVTSGTAICDAINSLTTDANDKPLTPVTINSIRIYGPSYAGFNTTPNTLPVVCSAQPVMKVSGTNYTLGYTHAAYSNYVGYHTADLSSWTNYISAYYAATAPDAGDINVNGAVTGNKHFFNLSRTDYNKAVNHFAPTSFVSKTLSFSSPWGLITCAVSSDGYNGTWNSGTLICGYAGAPYYEVFETILSSTYHFTLNLYYGTATTGSYSGQTNIVGSPWITGTFSSTP